MKVPISIFPNLPTLDAFLRANPPGPQNRWDGIGIVCCQHLLATTGSLIECLIRMGLAPQSIFVMGKVYSTNFRVVRKLVSFGCQVNPGSPANRPGAHQAAIEHDADVMWKSALEFYTKSGTRRIIVLDDGGILHLKMPVDVAKQFSIVGIEQTTFGMAHNAAIGTGGVPVINVASSAAKRQYEAPLIADAVIRRVGELVSSNDQQRICGVLGLGKIGVGLVQSLKNMKCNVVGFDRNPQRLLKLEPRARCSAKQDLLSKAQIIFGCAGEDTLTNGDFQAVKGTRTLISCSSSDIEFRTVLLGNKKWRRDKRDRKNCANLECQIADNRIRVLRSGYPINFDNSLESVPAQEIQLTRGLLLAGVLQARKLVLDGLQNRTGSIMLDPKMQRLVVAIWRDYTARLVGTSHGVDWFAKESQGALVA